MFLHGEEVEQANKESISFYLIALRQHVFFQVEKFEGKRTCFKDTRKSYGKLSWNKQQTEGVFKQSVSTANGFYYHWTTESRPGAWWLPPAHQAGTGKLVTRMVSPQPTSDIAVQLQKEDLKEAPSCYLNKPGSHRDREQSNHWLLSCPSAHTAQKWLQWDYFHT